MSDFLLLTIYAAIGGVAGIVGGALLITHKRLAEFLCSYAVALAAGVFLALIFFDLLPESSEMIGGEASFIVISLTILVAYVLEKMTFLIHHHHDEKGKLKKSSIPLVLFGDTIHNFIDGIAIGAAFAVEPNLGLFVAISSFLHETPHEIADFGILISSGWSRMRALRANFLSALATFPGAYFAYSLNNDTLTGILLAIAAGVFMYVAGTDFIPQIFGKDRKELLRLIAIAIVGFSLIYATGVYFHPHVEDADHEETIQIEKLEGDL